MEEKGLSGVGDKVDLEEKVTSVEDKVVVEEKVSCVEDKQVVSKTQFMVLLKKIENGELH